MGKNEMKIVNRFSGIRRILIASAASVALLLSACDSAVLTDPDAVVTDTVVTEDALDIITTAENAGTFNTLLAAIEAADLRTALADPANVNTVFAPTDAAFEALGEEAITALLADPIALEDVLLYHVLAGSNDSVAITDLAGTTVTMNNNKEAAVILDGETLRLNTSAITTADIMASNGIIHVIDTVLTPPADAPAEVLVDMAQLLSEDAKFSTLTTALQAANLDATLAADGDFTLFAPNNDAFTALGEENLNALLADTDALTQTLLYHLVNDKVIDSTEAIASAGQTITSAAGATLAVTLDGENLMINDATVVRADLQGSNGVVHEIDVVLQQPEDVIPKESIVDVLAANPEYSSLVGLINQAGLAETLADVTANFTVFAPNNAALAAADAELQAGFTANPVALAGLLQGHVHATTLTSADIVALDGTGLTMLDGFEDGISVVDGEVMIGAAKVVEADMQATNGVIHGIDAVLLD